jgi:hypothetical protein
MMATRHAADPRMTVVLIIRNRREELARTLDMMTSLPEQPCSAWTRRSLLTGWFSFRHGEVTVGDLLALESVS